MQVAARITQAALGLYFAGTGVVHFTLPAGLPAQMAWMYDVPAGAHAISGGAEIAAGVVLLLGIVMRPVRRLVLPASLGLIGVMFLAAMWHSARGETQMIASNVVVAALLALVAVLTWRSSSSRPVGQRPR